ncbi:glycosyltransferase family 2 protein [Psychrosphaera aestuarii]|uniref:glycosyltransferase family 2 protein n=1 Tax=Psychrosphaera aestuarii TaxID=1266052 RepID=UPI001B3246CD|nr:glycosyltransferase family 2 protein [Psychrosphaera aestuarii]
MFAPISVVIPAYNMENLITKTLDSLTAQTVSPTEVIVVNDGSTDLTLAVVQSWLDSNDTNFSVQIIDKTNGGLSSARNCGIRAASYELIALLDSDDRYEPKFIETALSAFEAKSGLALFFANQRVVDEHDQKMIEWLEIKSITECRYSKLVGNINLLNESIIPKLVNGNFISCSASVFNKSFFNLDELYDESLKAGEDVEFLMRVLRDKHVAFTYDELAIVLRHSGSITQSKRHVVHMGRIFALNKNYKYLQAHGVDVEGIVKQQFAHCYYQLSLLGLNQLISFSKESKATLGIYYGPSLKDYLRAFISTFNK